MIKSTQLIKLIDTYQHHRRKMDDWIELLPDDISITFFDNTYVNHQAMIIDHLMQQVLGDLYDDVSWFLYDWKPGFDIQVGETTYKINNQNDYIEYLKSEHLIED